MHVPAIWVLAPACAGIEKKIPARKAYFVILKAQKECVCAHYIPNPSIQGNIMGDVAKNEIACPPNMRLVKGVNFGAEIYWQFLANFTIVAYCPNSRVNAQEGRPNKGRACEQAR